MLRQQLSRSLLDFAFISYRFVTDYDNTDTRLNAPSQEKGGLGKQNSTVESHLVSKCLMFINLFYIVQSCSN